MLRYCSVSRSGPEFTEVGYGAAKCRAIFTAVNNRLGAREILGILADAEPRVLVVDPGAVPSVTGVAELGFDCTVLVTDPSYRDCRDAAPPEDPGEIAGLDETALILYTSGTTGAPKGVELTGRNLGCALHELPCPSARPPTGARSATWSAGPRRSRCPCSGTPPRSSAARSCSPTD